MRLCHLSCNRQDPIGHSFNIHSDKRKMYAFIVGNHCFAIDNWILTIVDWCSELLITFCVGIGQVMSSSPSCSLDVLIAIGATICVMVSDRQPFIVDTLTSARNVMAATKRRCATRCTTTGSPRKPTEIIFFLNMRLVRHTFGWQLTASLEKWWIFTRTNCWLLHYSHANCVDKFGYDEHTKKIVQYDREFVNVMCGQMSSDYAWNNAKQNDKAHQMFAQRLVTPVECHCYLILFFF